MYSRSFYPEQSEKPSLPDNYDGTAFMESTPRIEEATEPTSITPDVQDTVNVSECGGGILDSMSRIPFLSGLFGDKGGIRLPKIGMEEILILGVAAMLFFSKEGDKECAIILILLLFIS